MHDRRRFLKTTLAGVGAPAFLPRLAGAFGTAAGRRLFFARINHRGGREHSCDGTSAEIAATLQRARANGKAVVGMKIFGAGTLTKPEDRDASLRYVLGGDLVDALTIGMTSPDQVTDNVRRIGAALALLTLPRIGPFGHPIGLFGRPPGKAACLTPGSTALQPWHAA